MEQDLEEDESLIKLDSENLTKFIQSFDLYLEDPNETSRIYLLTDNLVEFLDYMPKIKTGYYDGFKELLTEISSKIEVVKEASSDKTIIALLNESLNLINEYLKDYVPKEPKKYDYKFPEYSIYKRKPRDEQSSQIGKRFAKHLLSKSNPHYQNYNTDEELYSMIDSIALKGEENSPQVTKLFNESLQRLIDRKKQYQIKMEEIKALNNRKLELSSKKEELNNFRSKMLGKAVDLLIAENKGD